jgi:KTSC domain-containing protein
MTRAPVHSSSIASVGYSMETATLEVEFRRGPTYQYFNVPPLPVLWLMAAPSKGAFFNQHIRTCYRYQRVAT